MRDVHYISNFLLMLLIDTVAHSENFIDEALIACDRVYSSFPLSYLIHCIVNFTSKSVVHRDH